MANLSCLELCCSIGILNTDSGNKSSTCSAADEHTVWRICSWRRDLSFSLLAPAFHLLQVSILWHLCQTSDEDCVFNKNIFYFDIFHLML
jgi:hypothetical protein